MTWRAYARRREWLAGIFLLAVTLINLAGVIPLLPFLRKGYQDFTIFYGSGEMVRSGQARRLYDLDAQYVLQKQFAPKVEIRHAALPYNHPPFEALLFAPFSYLNYVPAYGLWTFLNLVMLALSLRIARKAFPEVGALNWGFVVLAALGFAPLVQGIMQGQDSVLLLLLATVALASLEEGRDVIAGAALGAGLFRFHLMLPLTVILAVRRPRLLLGFAPVAAALVAISAMMVGWSGLVGYTHLLFRLENQGSGGVEAATMPNLRGLLEGVVGHSVPMWATIVCSTALLGIALWQVRRPEASLRFAFAVAGVSSVMLSYHSVLHDLTWLLPVLLLLFATAHARGGEGMEADVILLVIVYTMLMGSAVWPGLNPWWFVPVAIWIFSKGMNRNELWIE